MIRYTNDTNPSEAIICDRMGVGSFSKAFHNPECPSFYSFVSCKAIEMWCFPHFRQHCLQKSGSKTADGSEARKPLKPISVVDP